MKEKTHDIISYVLGSVSCAIGITDVKEVLNIVLIVLGILNILLVLTLKVIQIIKSNKADNEKLAEIEAVVNEATDKLGEYNEKT